MKICILANPNSPHTRRWVDHFAETDHVVHLIGEHEPELELQRGVIFHDLTLTTNTRKYRYARWALEVRKIVYQIQPELIHAFGVASAGWLAYLSGFRPYILTAMGSDINLLPKKSYFFNALTRITLRNAEVILCVSNQLAEKIESMDISPRKINVSYLGVDTDIFHPCQNMQKLRSHLSLGTSPLILSIRAMQPIYNPLDIARAAPIVLSHISDTRFLIFTYNQDDQTLARFKSIIQESNSGYAVKYVENLADDHAIAEYYQAADIAVSVPSSDGTPISVLECMACETPLVLSDLPELHDWVTEEQEGLFTQVGDYEALAEALIRLLSDTKLRDQLGHNARKVVQNRVYRKIWMQKSEQIYTRFAGREDQCTL